MKNKGNQVYVIFPFATDVDKRAKQIKLRIIFGDYRLLAKIRIIAYDLIKSIIIVSHNDQLINSFALHVFGLVWLG